MKRFKLTEDWTATVVGWLIILLIVCQFKPTWPSFAWPDAEILLNKVIALDNVGHSLIVFGFMFCLALIAVKILCYIAHSFKAGAKKFCWNKVYFIKNYHAVTEIVELSQS